MYMAVGWGREVATAVRILHQGFIFFAYQQKQEAFSLTSGRRWFLLRGVAMLRSSCSLSLAQRTPTRLSQTWGGVEAGGLMDVAW